MRSPISIQREVIKTFVSVDESQLGTRAGMVLIPTLTANELADAVCAIGIVEDNCPICLNTLAAAIAEEEMVIANDTPVSPDLLGVVKLETCSHHFCRKWCVRLLVRDLGRANCSA